LSDTSFQTPSSGKSKKEDSAAMPASDLELYDDETNKSPDPKIASDSEAETIRRVLSTLREHEKRRLQSGFNEFNFSIGVLNTILIAYTFGAHPGKSSFWIVTKS
jgi:hypothetical protein